VLEVSETETIDKYEVFVDRVNRWRAIGVKFAIDDFGSGYSGLNLLAEFQPEAIKLDMALVRDIGHKGPRQAVIRGVIRTCEDLGIDIVAEGVETIQEAEWLHNEGIVLFQGYLFAKPGFRHLPEVTYPVF
jgi:blue light- and temperature-responsive anti-repressor